MEGQSAKKSLTQIVGEDRKKPKKKRIDAMKATDLAFTRIFAEHPEFGEDRATMNRTDQIGEVSQQCQQEILAYISEETGLDRDDLTARVMATWGFVSPNQRWYTSKTTRRTE